MIFVNGFINRIKRMLAQIDRSPKRVQEFPIFFAVKRLSFDPMLWLIITVLPIARPTIITVTMCINWLPTDTAVITSAPLNCPIIKRSASPYKTCNNVESTKGIEKTVRFFMILPWVKSFFIALIYQFFS